MFEDDNIQVKNLLMDHTIKCSGFLFKEKKTKRKVIKRMIEKYSVPFNKIESLKNGADWIDNNGNIIPNSILTDKNTDSFTYAYCTDTRFSKQLVNKLEGVKLLYHETTFMHDLKERADKTGHSTTIEAATIAKKG